MGRDLSARFRVDSEEVSELLHLVGAKRLAGEDEFAGRWVCVIPKPLTETPLALAAWPGPKKTLFAKNNPAASGVEGMSSPHTEPPKNGRGETKRAQGRFGRAVLGSRDNKLASGVKSAGMAERRTPRKPSSALAPIVADDQRGHYGQLLSALKERVRSAQLRAGLAVNRELVPLYWQIGKDILENQERLGWGAKVVDRLSRDLHQAFPTMRGFSPRNLKYMRALAEAYTEAEFVQQAVAQIPWGHNVRILDRAHDRATRDFYIRGTVEHGWSRDVLEMQIDSRLHERQGGAVTNFPQVLPPAQSDLAQQILKDPTTSTF
jgi:predicted nuclease of restriction endonuclease-like (RecB) superfamily